MPQQGPRPKITRGADPVLKKRFIECVDRFSYYEKRMQELAKKNKDNYDRVIYTSAANVWNLAKELLLRGPAKKMVDETLSGRREPDISEQIERRNDDDND